MDSSFSTGRKTPGASPTFRYQLPKSGVSNCGTMSVSGSCLTSILENREVTSGTSSKSYLNRSVSNMVLKSLGI